MKTYTVENFQNLIDRALRDIDDALGQMEYVLISFADDKDVSAVKVNIDAKDVSEEFVAKVEALSESARDAVDYMAKIGVTVDGDNRDVGVYHINPI